MSINGTLKRVCCGLAIALLCGVTVLAQETGPVQPDNAPSQMQREGRRRGRDHKMMGLMRDLRELNLSEAQQQNVRAIFERFNESTKPQREALRQLRGEAAQGKSEEEIGARAMQLRGEIRNAMQSARAEVSAMLTPEQRARFEQLEQERKARHEEHRSRRRQ